MQRLAYFVDQPGLRASHHDSRTFSAQHAPMLWTNSALQSLHARSQALPQLVVSSDAMSDSKHSHA